jgi:hypothetical protein
MNSKIVQVQNSITTAVAYGLVLASIITVCAVGYPMWVEAATYAYVNTSGEVKYVSADTSAGAMASATGIAMHSGVMIVANTSTNLGNTPVVVVGQAPVAGQMSGYAYVNTSGQVIHTSATSAASAFASAINIALNSGVMLINSVMDSQVIGDTVRIN